MNQLKKYLAIFTFAFSMAVFLLLFSGCGKGESEISSLPPMSVGEQRKNETAKDVMEQYTEALKKSDYRTMYGLAYQHNPTEGTVEEGQRIWDTVKISNVKIIREDVGENRACYMLELTVDQAGDSAFSEGVEPRGLWLIKKDNRWYVEGLMSSGAPDSAWWDEG